MQVREWMTASSSACSALRVTHLHAATAVLSHSDSSLQMAPARRAALPRKLLATLSRAMSHTAPSRPVLTQAALKASAKSVPVRAILPASLTKGLKSCRQRLHDLQGVSAHL